VSGRPRPQTKSAVEEDAVWERICCGLEGNIGAYGFFGRASLLDAANET
jgi:hypothetical protein